MKRNILVFTVIMGIAAAGCSRFDTSTSLKQSVETGVAKINVAVSEISNSKGYQLLSVSENLTKSEMAYSDSIDLDMFAGVYDFKPFTTYYNQYPYPVRFFRKTGESDSLIVNMPQMLVLQPRKLYYYLFKDSTLANNFTVAASDYHLYYSPFNRYDYKLAAGFLLDNEAIGSMDLTSVSAGWAGLNYSSKFTFVEGFDIEVTMERGDTSTASFALSEGDDLLLKEARIYTSGNSDSKHYRDREKTYILTIGNVDIVKSSEIDSIQVFLNGTLQAKAAVRIIDQSDTTGTICNKNRDLLITFDDGTTANLSELIAPALDTLSTLVGSLNSMYFAKHIVDYIALNIYFHEFRMPHTD